MEKTSEAQVENYISQAEAGETIDASKSWIASVSEGGSTSVPKGISVYASKDDPTFVSNAEPLYICKGDSTSSSKARSVRISKGDSVSSEPRGRLVHMTKGGSSSAPKSASGKGLMNSRVTMSYRKGENYGYHLIKRDGPELVIVSKNGRECAQSGGDRENAKTVTVGGQDECPVNQTGHDIEGSDQVYPGYVEEDYDRNAANKSDTSEAVNAPRFSAGGTVYGQKSVSAGAKSSRALAKSNSSRKKSNHSKIVNPSKKLTGEPVGYDSSGKILGENTDGKQPYSDYIDGVYRNSNDWNTEDWNDQDWNNEDWNGQDWNDWSANDGDRVIAESGNDDNCAERADTVSRAEASGGKRSPSTKNQDQEITRRLQQKYVHHSLSSTTQLSNATQHSSLKNPGSFNTIAASQRSIRTSSPAYGAHLPKSYRDSALSASSISGSKTNDRSAIPSGRNQVESQEGASQESHSGIVDERSVKSDWDHVLRENDWDKQKLNGSGVSGQWSAGWKGRDTEKEGSKFMYYPELRSVPREIEQCVATKVKGQENLLEQILDTYRSRLAMGHTKSSSTSPGSNDDGAKERNVLGRKVQQTMSMTRAPMEDMGRYNDLLVWGGRRLSGLRIS